MGEPVRRSRASLPAGLVVGAVMTVLGLGGFTLGLALDPGPRWFVFGEASIIAGSSLMAIGAYELARRLTRQRAIAAYVATGGFAAWAAIRGVVVFSAVTNSGARDIENLGQNLSCAALVVACGALAVAASWGRNPVAIGGALVLGAAVAPPYAVTARVFDMFGETPSIVLYVGALVLWAAMIVVFAARGARDAAEAPEDQSSAIVGLRRASTALWIRLGSASLLMAVTTSELAKIAPVVNLISGGAGAIAMALFASALVRVARGSGTALPGMRLAVATGLAVWAAAAQSIHTLGVYALIDRDLPWSHHRAMWPLLTPIVAASGIVVLLWAIGRLAVASGDDKLRRTASTTMKAYMIVMGIGLAALAMAAPSQWGNIVMSLATTMTVCSLVLAASLCAKAAQAIEARPALATATLRANDRA